MNRLQIVLLILFGYFSTCTLRAQVADTIESRPGQITFVTPFGTNGYAAGRTINNFSLNILLGVSAGVEGAELGGLFNQTNGDVSGLQMAGLGNNAGKLRGAQCAGLFNINSASFQGLEAAGLMNITMSGEEYSGGVQLGGVFNKNANPHRGLQVAGVFNLQTDSMRGMQVAGVMNRSEQVCGVQISGVVNQTKSLSGVQIGLINIAERIEKGVQIGLINIVKNGYHAVEVEYNESFYVNVAYKMGARPLYSIAALSYEKRNGKNLWAVGYGFGTYHQIGIKTGVNVDAIHYWVNEDAWWTDELNMLEKLKVNASYHFSPHLAVYGGASLNVQLSKIKDTEGEPKGSLLKTPDAFFDEVHHNTHIIIYPGLHAGLRF